MSSSLLVVLADAPIPQKSVEVIYYWCSEVVGDAVLPVTVCLKHSDGSCPQREPSHVSRHPSFSVGQPPDCAAEGRVVEILVFFMKFICHSVAPETKEKLDTV